MTVSFTVASVGASITNTGNVYVNGTKDGGVNGNLYKVTYDKNAASATGSVPVDGLLYKSGVSVTALGNVGVPPLARAGYVFAGWNTNSAGTGTNYSGGGVFSITGNITLYARWRLVPAPPPASPHKQKKSEF